MCSKMQKKASFIKYIEGIGFYVDINRYEALSGNFISEDRLIDDVYNIIMNLIVNQGMSTRQACEYLYEIGKLNKK